MKSCTTIDPLVTPYLDGELPAADRQRVDDHVGRCPPCRSRVAAEDAARRLVHERKAMLTAAPAPPALRKQCALFAMAGLKTRATPDTPAASGAPTVAAPAAAARNTPTVVAQVFRPAAVRRFFMPRRLLPLALAASLVMAVGGVFLYRGTGSSARLMAAELTADHVKCFGMDDLLGTHDSPTMVETSMLSGFDWHVHMPEDLAGVGLQLVGSRPCLYARGKVAHIMYRYQGRPVSIFMVPGSPRADDLVEVFGHEAVIWSVGDRTFVLIARGSRDEVMRMASFVRASLH
jgi:anti-sigma factor RsiW